MSSSTDAGGGDPATLSSDVKHRVAETSSGNHEDSTRNQDHHNNNSSNNKRKRQKQPNHRSSNKKSNKATSRKESAKQNTWRRPDKNAVAQHVASDTANSADATMALQDGGGSEAPGDGGDDYRGDTPSAGSFAHPSLREAFGVELWESEEQKRDALEGTEMKSKRKVAMLIGFLGTNYGGFQSNPQQKTLQAILELAMFRCGWISDSNFGWPHKYSWSNAARTDKGVHACAQVCSAKIVLPDAVWDDTTGVELDRARERLNAQLPSDITVMDLARTTRSFCGKTGRDRVRYQYMIPSFLLHPDWKRLFEENGIVGDRRRKEKYPDKEPYLTSEEKHRVQESLKGYRSTEESRQLLQTALRKYEGTKQFHSFTRGLRPGQAQAQRFIESFNVQNPVVVDGVEWVPTQVLGQSFLLHQIRKMISVAVDVARGRAPLDFMDQALSKETYYTINTAPAQGLFLEMSFYGGYNRHKKKQNSDLPDLDWTVDGPAKDRWAAFRDVIRQHIIQEESELGSFVHYMYVQDYIYGVAENYRLSDVCEPTAVETTSGPTQDSAVEDPSEKKDIE